MLKCLYMVQNVNQERNLQDISASTSALQWLKNWIMITVLDNRLCIIYNIAFVKRRLIKIHLAFVIDQCGNKTKQMYYLSLNHKVISFVLLPQAPQPSTSFNMFSANFAACAVISLETLRDILQKIA